MIVEIKDQKEYDILMAIGELDPKTKKAIDTALNAFLLCDRKWEIRSLRAMLMSSGEQNIFLYFTRESSHGGAVL